MREELLHVIIDEYTTESSFQFSNLQLTYQLFGKKLGTAPVVLVNHALTGNSNVSGKSGWWNNLIGPQKVIDTLQYTVLCFNIPGNGYDGFIIENYKDFVARDIAHIFLKGLEQLEIHKLFALIGGSLGGGIAWEMAVLNPTLIQHLIPVSTDWKATDWMIANCQIQEQLLVNSKEPVHDARMHAMLCYRTPKSFKNRFKRSVNNELNIFNVESWLLHHGKKLQERFQLSAYKLMNQLLKTIDVTRDRDIQVLDKIQSKIHIVGVDSDLFFTAEENRETQKRLARKHANVTYHEIHSDYGHDAFLIEHEQLQKIIAGIFNSETVNEKYTVVKFGGKSLANGKGIKTALSIIEEKLVKKEKIVVVASARGNTTDELLQVLEKAANKENYKDAFNHIKKYQSEDVSNLDFSEDFLALENIFEGVSLLGGYSEKVKDLILAYGELLSVKTLEKLLKDKGIKSNAVDARKLIKTDDVFGKATPIDSVSKQNVVDYFKKFNGETVNIVTGFIASNSKNETTTLGRNGSNYTASLIANYLEAEELQNYTHVDGIYTADPNLVKGAKKIEQLSFEEANELASFGASILHAKTIVPLLEKNINLRIINTFNPKDSGTLITTKSNIKGIKSLSVLEDVALLNLTGRGLLGKVGVDARIFKVLSDNNISVSIISQGSSERGIGLVIPTGKAEIAQKVLQKEFEREFHTKDISSIEINDQIAVISIIGLELKNFHKPFNRLIKNHITPVLFSNTVAGKNVSLVVRKEDLHKALNVVHGEVFGVSKKVNLAIFGHGLVGGTLIDQIVSSAKEIERKKGVQLRIFAIANSNKALLKENGIGENWRSELETDGKEYAINDILSFANEHHLENLIAIDNTASLEFVTNYHSLVKNGFDLVSSNKIANTIDLAFYKSLRLKLKKYQKRYLYETNVGAGLPLIDTIKLLHLSGENITRIRGVFSGSLSYLFNNFSTRDDAFSTILREAIEKGYTEPDAREDLSGKDVARKLLILARELDLHNELEDVDIQNLIPIDLQNVEVSHFLNSLQEMNENFQSIKEKQKPDHVLRYVGDLSGNLSDEKGAKLTVDLVSAPKDSPLGSLKGSDSIFEIYTESYNSHPLVIQGAGAGAQVTARGVFGDILRLIETNSEG